MIIIFTVIVVGLGIALMFALQAANQRLTELRELRDAVAWADNTKPFIDGLEPDNYATPYNRMGGEKPATVADWNYYRLVNARLVARRPQHNSDK